MFQKDWQNGQLRGEVNFLLPLGWETEQQTICFSVDRKFEGHYNIELNGLNLQTKPACLLYL